LLTFALSFHQYQLMDRIRQEQLVTADEIATSDNWGILLGPVWLLWYLATIVVFLMWTHRVHRNLPSLGATGLEFSPRGAVGWYFVPFLNLFKPYQAMREIYNASEPSAPPEHGPESRSRNAAVVVKTWWALFLLMNFVNNAVTRASFHADTPGSVQFVAAATMVAEIFSIASMLSAIWLVRSVTKRQELRAAALGLPD
jgi:hypothetical protein